MLEPPGLASGASSRQANGTSAQGFQDLENRLVIGLFALLVHVDVANNTLAVDHEDRPLRAAIGSQHAVLDCHVAVRPEVAEERIVDPAKRLGPGAKTGSVVDR
jgi:hypothetical protein